MLSAAARDAAGFLWSSGRLIFFARDALGTPPEHDGLGLRYATPDDARRYARDVGTESPRTFRLRLTSSTRCLLVLEGDRILHSSWVTEGDAWTVELRRYVSPPPNEAYVYESLTQTDARGRGLYPLALKWICHDAAQNFERVWVGVEDDNVPSLKAVTKAGFQEALSVDFRRRLGRTTLRLEAAAGENERPRLNVSHHPARVRKP